MNRVSQCWSLEFDVGWGDQFRVPGIAWTTPIRSMLPADVSAVPTVLSKPAVPDGSSLFDGFVNSCRSDLSDMTKRKISFNRSQPCSFLLFTSGGGKGGRVCSIVRSMHWTVSVSSFRNREKKQELDLMMKKKILIDKSITNHSWNSALIVLISLVDYPQFWDDMITLIRISVNYH